MSARRRMIKLRPLNTARAFLFVFLFLGCIVPVTGWPTSSLRAEDLTYPQIIKMRYEALDLRTGGNFIIWVEREKIWYGLDPKIFPAAKSVDVTHITPAPGTTTITFIAVTGVNSEVPDYFHLSGNIRFKVSGMKIVSSNIP
jgi:hypothetical protein